MARLRDMARLSAQAQCVYPPVYPTVYTTPVYIPAYPHDGTESCMRATVYYGAAVRMCTFLTSSGVT